MLRGAGFGAIEFYSQDTIGEANFLISLNRCTRRGSQFCKRLYIDASTQSSFKGLPKIAAKFDPHHFNLRELVKQFRDERSCERSERGSGALLEKISYRGSGIASKE